MIGCLFGRHDPIPIRRTQLAGTGGWEAWLVRCRGCKREQSYRLTPNGRHVDATPWERP